MTIKSMTAFGFGETTSTSHQYRCEIKSLNARFIDTYVKLPRSMSALESLIITELKKQLKRGKIDVQIHVSATNQQSRLPKLNTAACQHYLAMAEQLTQLCPNSSKSLSHYELLRLEGVLEQTVEEQTDPATLHKEGLMKALKQAIDMIQNGRSTEGAALYPALTQLVGQLSQGREAILAKSDTVQETLYQNYENRLQSFIARMAERSESLPSSLSEDRLASEITILADKCDIAEELTRLKAHEAEFLKTLEQGGEIGRKLDFLCQELHREVNTISSKIGQLDIVTHTLAMKQAIERLRQQVQNIE